MAALADMDVPDVPTWTAKQDQENEPHLNPDVTPAQKKEMLSVIHTFSATFTSVPGQTDKASITIDTGEANPIHTPPYKGATCSPPAGEGRGGAAAEGWYDHAMQEFLGISNSPGTQERRHDQALCGLPAPEQSHQAGSLSYATD